MGKKPLFKCPSMSRLRMGGWVFSPPPPPQRHPVRSMINGLKSDLAPVHTYTQPNQPCTPLIIRRRSSPSNQPL